MDGKGIYRDATGKPIDSSLFDPDPLPPQEIPKEIIEELLEMLRQSDKPQP
jgi:hypothetical protein